MDIGLDNKDKASKSIKQLGLLSIMPSLNHNILKETMTRMMERIVRSESSSHRVRLPKKIRKRRRSSMSVEVTQGQNESVEGEQQPDQS